MLDIPFHPKFQTNMHRAIAVGADPCIVCGKAVTAPRHWLHTYYGSAAVTEAEAEALNDGGDSGCYPVGTDCLRRHPELRPYVVTH